MPRKTVLAVGMLAAAVALSLPLVIPALAQRSVATVSASAQANDPAEALPPIALKTANFDPAFMAPVDGVSVRRYAHAVFDLFAHDDRGNAKVLATYGLTEARFEKITAVMTKRMQDDPTRKFIEIYGAYFIETAEGKYAALATDVARSVLNGVPLVEKAPMTWDEYMSIQGYYARKAPFARDTSRAAYDEILAAKGLTFVDFQVLGAWFGRHIATR